MDIDASGLRRLIGVLEAWGERLERGTLVWPAKADGGARVGCRERQLAPRLAPGPVSSFVPRAVCRWACTGPTVECRLRMLLDLAALNIQRGRDHGLPDYNTVRIAFGLAKKTSFLETGNGNGITTNATLAAAISTQYGGDIDVVDPWIGALAEDHVDDKTAVG